MLQYTEDEIVKDFFPMEKPRAGQIKIVQDILKAFEKGKRIVILDLPVGAGKSAIAKTIANMFNSTCYATSQIILQEQLIGDFGAEGKFRKGFPMVHLKGRSNYSCVYPDIADLAPDERKKLKSKKMTCATGFCKLKGASMCGECIDENATEEYPLTDNKCPYWARVDQFLESSIGLINFKAYLYQKAYSKYFWLYKPELLILDEAHNLERELLDFVGLSFTDKLLTPVLGKRLPKFNTPEQYKEWFKELDIVRKLAAESLIAKSQERLQQSEELEELAGKINKFLLEDMTNWVVKVDESFKANTRIDLKPIFIKDQARKLIFNQADFIIMMSATILSADVICDSLGLKKDDIEYISLPSTFPIENRKIHWLPVGSMSYKSKAQTFPKLLEAVYELCELHEEEKGIIHTHNFQIAEAIMENVPNHLKMRLLFQKNFHSKEEMLEVHARSKNTVIVAPAMHEGLDLKEDLSRFQIICKIPYPNYMDDPQLKKRMELSQDYYNWLTCLKICQAYGRSIRSETDKAETYILDSDFSKLLASSSHMLPAWFKEAIVN